MSEEIKFGPAEDELFQILNPNVCEYMQAGKPFCIEEKDDNGKAEIVITPECPCFVVRCMDEKARIRSLPFFNQTWKAVTQCADHVVFLFDDANKNWILHVFEMKRAPDLEKWKHILQQFNGAMVRSYAIAGALRIPEFSEIHLHCCYRKDMSSPAKLKALPGESAPKDFLKAPITLVSYPKLPVKNAGVSQKEGKIANKAPKA